MVRWQLIVSRLIYEANRGPRHATHISVTPVETMSPPQGRRVNSGNARCRAPSHDSCEPYLLCHKMGASVQEVTYTKIRAVGSRSRATA